MLSCSYEQNTYTLLCIELFSKLSSSREKFQKSCKCLVDIESHQSDRGASSMYLVRKYPVQSTLTLTLIKGFNNRGGQRPSRLKFAVRSLYICSAAAQDLLNLTYGFVLSKLQTSNFTNVTNFKLQTSNFKLQTSNFKLQTSNFKLQTPNSFNNTIYLT